jgi:hypothetical protein
MALVLKDRVKETTTTTGTGTVTLAGAVSGFQSFGSIGNANTTYYAIIGDTEWEIGIGTYTSSGTTLSRDTVLASSNSGSLVSFSAGTKTVFCDYPATKSVSTDSLATPPAIGGTTPSTGTFTTLIGGGSSANYGQLTGGATTKAVEFQTLGSDSNIALVLDTKGTGAIDLAAGSSGVNISNGGTVTAITGTAGGSYTVVPTITISAPTTAGGTQATGTVGMAGLTISLASGGSGYAIGDTITLTGGTFTQAIVLTVATLSGSAVATFTTSNFGTYSVLATNPISQGSSSGAGTGATFNVTAWQVRTTAFTITNAGSGYVEQPTVTFSSGSATAYATVGSGTVVRSLGTTMDFYVPSGVGFRVNDGAAATTNYVRTTPSVTGPSIDSFGSGSNIDLNVSSRGTSSVRIFTNLTAQEQLRISHTASAVNYVQVTGSATTASPVVSAQGSDSGIGLTLQAKSASIVFLTRSTNGRSFNILDSALPVNYLQVAGTTAGNAPILSSQGSDTDIDLALTPKNAGAVRFGTYTASVLTPTGYITIKDSGGTSRRLLVG